MNIGDRFVEVDPRQKDRVIEVVEIIGSYALVKNVVTGRKTKIHCSRFSGKNKGYKEFDDGKS